jgi:hypothetical protein
VRPDGKALGVVTADIDLDGQQRLQTSRHTAKENTARVTLNLATFERKEK